MKILTRTNLNLFILFNTFIFLGQEFGIESTAVYSSQLTRFACHIKRRAVSLRQLFHGIETLLTRHRASTSMYSLIFCVRVTRPPQYGRNGTAHAAGASILSAARGVFAGMRSVRVRHACGVRWAWRITTGLCHAFP